MVFFLSPPAYPAFLVSGRFNSFVVAVDRDKIEISAKTTLNVGKARACVSPLTLTNETHPFGSGRR